MKKPKHAPKAFVEHMLTQGKIVPADQGWRDMPEWKLWASGFNAAVDAVNRRTMHLYDMNILKPKWKQA